MNQFHLFTIRLFDIFFAFCFLISFSIPFIIISIIIFFGDFNNPIFFQERLGRNRNIFIMYKLRSMVVLDKDLVYKTSSFNDPRITFIGRIIRKFSFDELAQVFNILKGEMSFVGIRPLTKHELHFYPAFYLSNAFRYRPGLTGISQINQKNIVNYTIDDRIKDDLFFLDNFNIKVYFYVLYKTFFVFLKNS